MKMLLLAVIAIATAFVLPTVSKAQAARGFPQVLPLVAGDTVVNTATITRKLPAFTGGYSALQLQVDFATNTGTRAGTLMLLASTDGTNYKQVDSSRVVVNALVSPQFVITGPPLAYYELSFTGSGTQSSTWSIWYRTPIYQTQ